MIDFYFFRHPQSEANEHPEIISGRSNNSLLTELGKKQTKRLRKRMLEEKIKFERVYSSPAVRCIRLGEIVFQKDKLLIDDRLQELNQGDWTGKLRGEMYTEENVRRMDANHWKFSPPNGESQAVTAKRMIEFINEIKTGRVAISGHGGAIKYTFAEIFDMNRDIAWRIPLENTSITQIRYNNGIWIPLRLNDFGHLPSNLRTEPNNQSYF